MYINIDIDNQKSPLFLDLLNLLKKDSMIKDFEVVATTQLTNYEKEVLEDISQIQATLNDAKSSVGAKKKLKVTL